jgi:hypothetical protein
MSIKIDTTKEFATDSDQENDTEKNSIVRMVRSPLLQYHIFMGLTGP